MTGTARWGGTALKGLAVLTFLILTASACGPAAEPPPAPPPPPPAPPPVDDVNKPDNGLEGIPGADPTATRDYLLSLGWGDNLPDSQIVQAEVAWPGNTGTVRIVPSVTANRVSWQTALTSGPGYFVAKIYNLENRALGPFGLGPLETGYLWVGATAPGQRSVRIYTFRNNGTVTPKGQNLSLKAFCPDGPHAVPAVKLKVQDCPEVAASAQQTGASSAPRFILASTTAAAFAQTARGLWFSCSGGCCEAGGIQVN